MNQEVFICKRLLLLVISCSIIAGASAQSYPSGCQTIDHSNFDLIFEDHFRDEPDDPPLNDNWDYKFRHGPYNDYDHAYNVIHVDEDELRRKENDLLRLFIKEEDPPIEQDGLEFNYSAGMVRSLFTEHPECDYGNGENYGGIEYGMVEIRAKMGSGVGFKSSLWMRGYGREIDIIEYTHHQDQSEFLTNIHYNVSEHDKSHCGAFIETGRDLSAEWHTYTVIWTPYKVTWFMDGVELRSVDEDIAHGCKSAMDIKASVRLNQKPEVIEEDVTHTPLLVDYVKIYNRSDNLLPGKFSWKNFNLNRTVSNASSDLSVNQNGKVFFRGLDNRMRYLAEITPGIWQPFDMDNSVQNVAGDITIDFSTGRIFYRGADNRIWIYWWDTDHWVSTVTNYYANDVLGGLALNQNGKIFYRSYGNQMYYLYKDNSGAWQKADMVGIDNVQSDIVIDKSTGRIFYIGTDNNVWVCWWTSSTSEWNQSPLNAGAQNAVNGLVLSPVNNDLLFYRGQSNTLHKVEKINGSWENKQIFGTSFSGTVGVAADNLLINNVGGDIVLLGNGHIYYRGLDGNVWEVYETPERYWYYQKINLPPGNVSASLIGGIDGGMFYISGQNEVYKIKPFDCERLQGIAYECGETIYFDGKVPGEHEYPEKIRGGQSVFWADSSAEPQEILISPNPAKEMVSIRLSGFSMEKYREIHLQVIDLRGRIQLAGDFQLSDKDSAIQLDLSDFQPGLYFLSFVVDENQFIKRIIKI